MVYDSDHRITAYVEPGGGRTTYSYDSIGRAETITSPKGEVTTYAYLSGLAARVTDPLNQTTTISFDSDGNVTGVTNPLGARATYTYDGVGNRTRVVEANGDRVTWTYDSAYQLRNEHRSGTNAYNTTHVYDPVGNRTLKNEDGARTTYTYDAANQLSTSDSSSGITTYTFDADGNQQIIEETVGTLATHTWDFENQNTLVELSDASRVTMVYNGDNRRVRKRAEIPVTNYIWDTLNDSYLMETDENVATTAVYTNEPTQFGGVISERRKPAAAWETSYHHYDALGSSRDLTDANETVTDTRIYSAFGETVDSTGSTATPFRYIGRSGYYFDQDLQDYYVRARYLRPSLSRWLSTDPLGNQGSELNLYTYVENRPLLLVDPEGLRGACTRMSAGATYGAWTYLGYFTTLGSGNNGQFRVKTIYCVFSTKLNMPYECERTCCTPPVKGNFIHTASKTVNGFFILSTENEDLLAPSLDAFSDLTTVLGITNPGGTVIGQKDHVKQQNRCKVKKLRVKPARPATKVYPTILKCSGGDIVNDPSDK